MPTKKSPLANIALPKFKNQDLLTTALTHRSALNELRRALGKSSKSDALTKQFAQESNERLEFFGDAILQHVASEFLFFKCPTEPEGVLTRYRSGLVNNSTLATVAKQLGLGEKLQVSKGEEGSGGRNNSNLLADALEAVIGALHCDQGYEAAKTFVLSWLEPLFDTMLAEQAFRDPKSDLQELVQAHHLPTPVYTVLEESGPDHNKQFVIGVLINEKEVARGEGTSKQRAEQAAAKAALATQAQWAE